MLGFALLGAEWVLWLLVAMSVVSVAVALERAAYLLRDGTDRAGLQAAFDLWMNDGEPAEVKGRFDALDGYEARVLSAGLDAHVRGPEAAERAMAGVVAGEKLRMERGLAVLATVGSNAPFVGLFGTVLGIIQAFNDLALDTADGSEAVMAGISGALVATAVGLMVAIPAVVLYNTFIRWVRGRQSRTESLAHLLLARFE